jgi:hypothetical protein
VFEGGPSVNRPSLSPSIPAAEKAVVLKENTKTRAVKTVDKWMRYIIILDFMCAPYRCMQ